MVKNDLNNIWESQGRNLSIPLADEIISIAKKQQNRQYLGIIIKGITILILLIYTFYYSFNKWNSFNLGLLIMVTSLMIRIIIEFFALYKKEHKLISLDHKTYQSYLKQHYKKRLIVNYIITPVCFISYIIGFCLLLPYFKESFSQSFYYYILVSGFLSMVVILGIIIRSISKEQQFLKMLKIK